MANRIVEADNRGEFGKGPAGRLRRSGKLPGIIYGRSDTMPITLDEHDFYQTFKQISESTIITIRTPGKDVDVLLKDFDEDLATGHLRHVDFYAIESGQLLRANVPIHLTGSAPGLREGVVLQSQIHEVEVECFPKDIPEYFELDISVLQVGDALHVSDLSDLEGVKVLIGFLEGVYVRPTRRRNGVASRLVSEVEAWVLAMGCTELASDAAIDNADSHRLHEALGFRETQRVVFFSKVATGSASDD